MVVDLYLRSFFTDRPSDRPDLVRQSPILAPEEDGGGKRGNVGIDAATSAVVQSETLSSHLASVSPIFVQFAKRMAKRGLTSITVAVAAP